MKCNAGELTITYNHYESDTFANRIRRLHFQRRIAQQNALGRTDLDSKEAKTPTTATTKSPK